MDGSASGRLRILHANVLSSNEQATPLLDLIAREQPDLLALHEINARWIGTLAGLADDYPYREGAPREDDFGILVLSRTPLQESAVRRFGHQDGGQAEAGRRHARTGARSAPQDGRGGENRWLESSKPSHGLSPS